MMFGFYSFVTSRSLSVRKSIFIGTQAVQGNIDFFAFFEFLQVSSLLEEFSTTS